MSFSNQVDGLHQQIVIEILIYLQQKVQADFAMGKGKNQSGDVEDEVFEAFGLALNFHMIKGRKVRSREVISEECFGVNQIFGVNELLGSPPNVVNGNKLCFVIFILILESKDPHFSDINEERQTKRIFLLHFLIFGFVFEGKVDLADGGRLLILCCIDNEVLK